MMTPEIVSYRPRAATRAWGELRERLDESRQRARDACNSIETPR